MPLQDQTVENHPNGSLGASEKLLKIPSQQLNGKFTEKKVEENEEEVAPAAADVVVPLDGGWGWVKENEMKYTDKRYAKVCFSTGSGCSFIHLLYSR